MYVYQSPWADFLEFGECSKFKRVEDEKRGICG